VDGAETSVDLLAIDGARPPIHVPSSGSTNAAMAWDRSGRVYYVDLYQEMVRSYDPVTGTSKTVLRVEAKESALIYALAAAP
jgi:streptogramin lyase